MCTDIPIFNNDHISPLYDGQLSKPAGAAVMTFLISNVQLNFNSSINQTLHIVGGGHFMNTEGEYKAHVRCCIQSYD